MNFIWDISKVYGLEYMSKTETAGKKMDRKEEQIRTTSKDMKANLRACSAGVQF